MAASFKVESPFQPTGDQPEAIDQLVQGFQQGNRFQTLLGVTGSGKTFTMAKVIERLQKPTLVLAHNKTLAAQLYNEFKEFFPNNAVEYFVSYYDYYQPEAYVPQSDTYIEKDASINEEIDRLRQSATMSLFERRDVIVVASVSCIYGLGDPSEYSGMALSLRVGMEKDRDEALKRLIEMQYDRNDMVMERGCFRVRGDVLEVMPAAYDKSAYRVEFFGDEVDRITEYDVLTGEIYGNRSHLMIYPASHYVTSADKMRRAITSIEEELDGRLKELSLEGKLLETQRLSERTHYDIEMMRETGFCSGIENYSRHMEGREPGSAPLTLLDYFRGDDYLLMIDESHMTIPQVRAMYHGDQQRKQVLVDYGFRLPSAKDNRPLSFSEFEQRINQVLFVSATPADYEKQHQELMAEQIIRPTGLIDPLVEVHPIEGQIDDLIGELNKVITKGQKALITTLTKRMAEDLTRYLKEAGIKVNYLHSDVVTLERLEIVRDLRMGVYDVLVGINLLREGLDIPEVSFIAILDADKEGFLRSETALIQTIGRAARNVEGRVVLYADYITDSMRRAMDETNRRREIQSAYNEAHGIVPQSIVKKVHDVIRATKQEDDHHSRKAGPEVDAESMSIPALEKRIEELKKAMYKAAAELEFETAAILRDQVMELKTALEELKHER
ncbi:MAG: excinuclease ABC subunit UvrB [Lachnospiraceae bacterium]|nr:excinuclease ABC subunit UvrB [Lachnospiraceae bacterium]